MVTLKDIAAEAGVSVMTVSRVVNNQKAKVSEENRKRIKAIIKARGYIPNSSARSLSSNTSRLIAILVQGVGNVLSYPYNANMVGYISSIIQQKGYSPLLYSIEDYHDITKRLRSWNVDGAIFLGMFDENMKNIQEDNTIPLVFTDSYSSIRQITNVGIDDFKGGELAAKYLYEHGHRNMAIIGGVNNNSSVIKRRLSGFQNALGQLGIELLPEGLLPDIPTLEQLDVLFNLKEPVTAMFATSDFGALSTIDQIRKLGLSIPDDCSVIGFDNLDIGNYSVPKLTTIEQDIERKAQVAVDTLLAHIKDPEAPSQNITLDVNIIERDSVKTRIPVVSNGG